ncbi:MAG: hypothetical protein WAL80_05620 [Xanthobacteraceae bacterium]
MIQRVHFCPEYFLWIVAGGCDGTEFIPASAQICRDKQLHVRDDYTQNASWRETPKALRQERMPFVFVIEMLKEMLGMDPSTGCIREREAFSAVSTECYAVVTKHIEIDPTRLSKWTTPDVCLYSSLLSKRGHRSSIFGV